MKSFAKRLALFSWRLIAPIRRPISGKVASLIQRSTTEAIRAAAHPQLGELLLGLAIMRREVGTYRNETNLLLDSLVREVTRLQDEVASLRAELSSIDLPTTIPIGSSDTACHELAESA